MVGPRLHRVDQRGTRPTALPRAPAADPAADLGFYDLRVAETRHAQGELARRYGVEAFVYWHYWFGSATEFSSVRSARCSAPASPTSASPRVGEPDVDRHWHGAPDRVLKQQTYPGLEDDAAHFETLLPAFRDERYLCVDGRPVFYVFRPEELPDAASFVDRWQGMARRAGLAASISSPS